MLLVAPMLAARIAAGEPAAARVTALAGDRTGRHPRLSLALDRLPRTQAQAPDRRTCREARRLTCVVGRE